MTKTQKFWITHPIKLPDGHRLFRAMQPLDRALIQQVADTIALPPQGGIWALADDSGEFPENTDDGILLLDFARPLEAGGFEETPTIPLLSRESNTSTVTDTPTLLKLSVSFAWPINCMDVSIQCVEI